MSVRKKQKRIFLVFIKQTFNWVIIFIFLFSLIIPLSFAIIFRNRIYPNVFIGSYNFSGKTKEEAIIKLTKTYQNLPSYQFHLLFENKEWVFKGSDWDLKIDAQESVNQAYKIGRDLSIFENINTLFQLQKQAIKIPLLITLDDYLFTQSIDKISEEIDIPQVNPTILVENGQIKIISGIPGRKLDQEALNQKIISAISENYSYNIQLPIIPLIPRVSKTEEEKTQKRAEQLINKKLTVILGENYYEIKNQELLNLISFTNGFDLEKIASLTANLAKAFDREPQNAAFKFEEGRVSVFRPSKNGQKLNQEKAIPLIMDKLSELEATTSLKLAITLPIIESLPEITTSEANDLGIRELLGRGISYFKGSIASRIHNINLASSRLNGILIKPGEIFSFNQALGDVSPATGYQQAYIIQAGRTVLGDGGGVCQVSTTLFRAALNAGLPIIERQAHAYRVSYYEQGFGPGLDATVFAPSVDLKIKNDTPAHILIQTNVDRENSRLTFELYGSSDGRIAYVGTPRVWDQTPPPPPRYEDDPTMPVGQEKQIDWAAWGAKAAFDYKVTRGNEVLIDKTFYSNFRPWQAVYLRGTKQ